MSELINRNDNRDTIRWKLLTGASVLALAAYTSSIGFAGAEEADRSTIWLELGGQLSALQDSQQDFLPPSMDNRPPIFEPLQKLEKPPGLSIDEYGKISFQPDNSAWAFGASVQYGRSSSSRHDTHHTSPLPSTKYLLGFYKRVVDPLAEKFTDTKTRTSERHLVLDFTAGKDIGLGMFGSRDSSSWINIGVRFAQFSSKSNFSLKSDPDWHFARKYLDYYGYHLTFLNQAFHSNLASLTAERSFHGLGPSISWKSSVPLAGNVQDGEIVADWGVNAALLFGRQRARTHHQTTARYYSHHSRYQNSAIPQTTGRFPLTPDHTRSRDVTVPNVGGSVGLSWRLQNFKMSLGYKADFFFNAMDGGIDARKSENRGFFGPYASISVGLGD